MNELFLRFYVILEFTKNDWFNRIFVVATGTMDTATASGTAAASFLPFTFIELMTAESAPHDISLSR